MIDTNNSILFWQISKEWTEQHCNPKMFPIITLCNTFTFTYTMTFIYIYFQTCSFSKQKSDTALYVSYGAVMRIYGCSGCCKRWYFTFNDQECSPVAVDGVVYQENTNNMNILRHRNIQGLFEIFIFYFYFFNSYVLKNLHNIHKSNTL